MAPNLNFYLFRPAMSEPPLCSWAECQAATLNDLADMHEALDLRQAQQQRAARAAKEGARNGRR